MAIKRFESLDEVRRLSGYVETIKKGEEFHAFVGYYKIPRRENWNRCGKVDCNQPHGFGFVVRTKSGAIAAVGHNCGEKVFGDLFTAAARAADAEMLRQAVEDGLAESLSRLPEYRRRAEAYLHGSHGAIWFDRAEASFQRAIPKRLAGRIYDCASRGPGTIERARLRTDNDMPPAGARGAEKYVITVVGRIVGVGALGGQSPKRLLVDRVLTEMSIFMTMTPGYLIDNKPQYRRFNEWVAEIPRVLDEVEAKLRRAEVFFATSNLRTLSALANDPADRHRLGSLRWNDDQGIVEVEEDMPPASKARSA